MAEESHFCLDTVGADYAKNIDNSGDSHNKLLAKNCFSVEISMEFDIMPTAYQNAHYD